MVSVVGRCDVSNNGQVADGLDGDKVFKLQS
jgi:hypothetical protein